MKLRYKQAETTKELKQILALQQSNLPEKLSAREKEKEGFVTVRHRLELLQEMNAVCGHIIAIDGSRVVGYALCMHPSFSKDIPVLQPMFVQLSRLLPSDYKYMVMGQVCVAKGYRGRGIFRGLYDCMKAKMPLNFKAIITEVDATNLRSLHAHQAVGFITLDTYPSGGQDWHLLRLDVEAG